MKLKAKQVFFNDRDGHTLLSNKERKGLRLTHVTNMKELDAAEQMNINEGLLWLNSVNSKDFVSEVFFKKLHKKLFGEVWKWAGEYRTSEKNIGVQPYKVASEMMKFEEDAKLWLEKGSFADWAELLAHFHHKLVFIHPFPNGNGRFSRIVTNYLCEQYGKPVPSWYPDLPPEERRAKYIDALKAADVKKYFDLIEFFKK
jgi:Fic-DOC domain mobile mystery protein B